MCVKEHFGTVDVIDVEAALRTVASALTLTPSLSSGRGCKTTGGLVDNPHIIRGAVSAVEASERVVWLHQKTQSGEARG